MILKRIEAHNILKYRTLRLTDLPEKGHIAVVGSNEAGKTAIGETICLGLFGRTFSLGPDEIGRVIRWGEYAGTVEVTFLAGDNGEFTVTREIDNTGGQRVRLEKAGASAPLAEGVEEVAQAIHDIGGFTYQSFIDSFYLAQREMEVPHAKSATVKALIGVDKLESVAREMEEEVATSSREIEALEAKIDQNHRKIAALNIDRARLGRLESERDAKAKESAAAESKAEQLANQAVTIAKTASAVLNAAKMFVQTTTQTSCERWRQREVCVSKSMMAVSQASAAAGLDAAGPAFAMTTNALKSIEGGLAEYDKIRDVAGLYRKRLLFLLDEPKPGAFQHESSTQAEANIEACFAVRTRRIQEQIDRAIVRRRTVAVVGAVAIEAAMLAWTAWLAPATLVGKLLHGLIPLAASSQDLALLLGAVVSTGVAALGVLLFVRLSNGLKQWRSELKDIEVEVQTSRAEIDVIDAIDVAPLPEALDALGCVRNDLLRSAVVSFSEGNGAVLIKPNALATKLAEIRNGSTAAANSLRKAKEKFERQAQAGRQEAAELHAGMTLIDRQISEERVRWKQLETMERNVAGLAAKANEARHQIVVRTVGLEMIEGACRQIYARFHPELRRFVSRILPRLTEDRYEHLEIDDDLRVRVFCKKKNDFVGLAEISNGTHRQLMLCVRLALSQALIASTNRNAQFIFFDEPFVFFDERRMAKAIDVLRKISPEITQVFLAAQHFKNPAAFDMCLNCDVGRETLRVSGKQRPTIPIKE